MTRQIMSNRVRRIMLMNDRVCPWWLCFTFDNPLRRLIHNPEKILRPWITPGQTAIDIGCGMGYFALPLARLVGDTGRVIAVDLQQQMLRQLQRRAARAGLQSRIQAHHCRPDTLAMSEPADFVLTFWMVHEVRNKRAFLQEVRQLLKPTGHYLLVEPKLHVAAVDFQKTVDIACGVGLNPIAQPGVWLSRAVVFEPAN
jgi:2-polyprenyl-3-methyl-5-hydroxy-6-metoxy-1,4-benzoquinol methylase